MIICRPLKETYNLIVMYFFGSDSKVSVYNAGDLGLIPGSGKFPGEGNGNPLQYSCLENPMDGGAWCRLLSMGSQRVGHDWATSLSPLGILRRGALTMPDDSGPHQGWLSDVFLADFLCDSLKHLKWSEVKSLSRGRLFATPWTVAYYAPLSMELSRQQYWNGLPFPSPGDLPNPGIESGSPAL